MRDSYLLQLSLMPIDMDLNLLISIIYRYGLDCPFAVLQEPWDWIGFISLHVLNSNVNFYGPSGTYI